ncbi:MAG: DUF1003 domain-containing protein [Geminicoccaceae bacterium]
MVAAHGANGHAVCQICGRHRREVPLLPAGLIRPRLVERIAKAVSTWAPTSFICIDDLNRFRADEVRSVIEDGIGEITTLEQSVVDRLADHRILSTNIDDELDETQTFGEKLADRVASFGGSWQFLILFAATMVLWMGTNTWILATGAFDPFPYILLNLVLSCLAAVQAPVIMMSQNRQETRDRRRSQNDYLVNLKAELEIRLLHEKVDHLLHHQWERLMEIQEIQVELMNQLAQHDVSRGRMRGQFRAED